MLLIWVHSEFTFEICSMMPLTVFPLRSAEDRIVPPPLGVSNEAQGSLHDIGEPRMGIGMHHLFFLAPGEPEILLILLNHDVIYVFLANSLSVKPFLNT